MKIYVFANTETNTEYEMEGFNEWDARMSLRDILGIDIEQELELLDVEFYSDGDDEYEDGIRRESE